VIHCFTGGPAHARAYLDLGFYVSFSGILTFPKGENVRESARAVPIERTLVETDAPFLAPEPHRGKRNEPAFVGRVVAVVAEVLGLPLQTVVEATTANFTRLLGVPIGRNPLVDNGLSR
jgi:TatD DNase family protein